MVVSLGCSFVSPCSLKCNSDGMVPDIRDNVASWGLNESRTVHSEESICSLHNFSLGGWGRSQEDLLTYFFLLYLKNLAHRRRWHHFGIQKVERAERTIDLRLLICLRYCSSYWVGIQTKFYHEPYITHRLVTSTLQRHGYLSREALRWIKPRLSSCVSPWWRVS